MPQINSPSAQLYMSNVKTNFGWMRPISDGRSLIRLDWNQTGWQEPDRPDDVSRETISQLQAFFDGRLRRFSLPLSPAGKSTVGRYWLETMANIPYGSVLTYTEFAILAGKPQAARAAGTSCSRNPIPIIYPCHRVICSGGALGYYRGGSDKYPSHASNVARKSALLHFETCQAANFV